MTQVPPTLDDSPPPERKTPTHAWVSFLCAVLSPLVFHVYSDFLTYAGVHPGAPPTMLAGRHYGTPFWYAPTATGAIQFAAKFAVLFAPPIAGAVYGISAMLRTWETNELLGKSLAFVGILVAQSWLLSTLLPLS